MPMVFCPTANPLKGIECHIPKNVCLAAYGTGIFS